MNTFLHILDQDKNKEEDIHYGIVCDVCEMKPIRGVRYKCMECPDFDLCEGCHDKELHKEHKMQGIVEKGW